MTSRLLSFLLWAAVAASAAFWGLQLGARPTPLPAQALVAVQPLPQAADLTRLFGSPPAPVEAAAPPPVAMDSRFKLLGVVAPARGQHAGLALIAVEGRAARALGVGDRVEGELAVRRIGHRQVELGTAAGGTVMVLDLPLLPEAARGQLAPAPDAGGMPAPPLVQPPAVMVPPPVRSPVPPARPGAAAGLQNLQPPPAPFGVTPQPAPTPQEGLATR